MHKDSFGLKIIIQNSVLFQKSIFAQIFLILKRINLSSGLLFTIPLYIYAKRIFYKHTVKKEAFLAIAWVFCVKVAK